MELGTQLGESLGNFVKNDLTTIVFRLEKTGFMLFTKDGFFDVLLELSLSIGSFLIFFLQFLDLGADVEALENAKVESKLGHLALVSLHIAPL
jgi:hypothetical protein